MAREMPNEDQTRKAPTHEEIAKRAYQVFLERGQPEGHDLDHWLEAEAQLKNAAVSQPKSAPGRSAKSSSRSSASRRS